MTRNHIFAVVIGIVFGFIVLSQLFADKQDTSESGSNWFANIGDAKPTESITLEEGEVFKIITAGSSTVIETREGSFTCVDGRDSIRVVRPNGGETSVSC